MCCVVCVVCVYCVLCSLCKLVRDKKRQRQFLLWLPSCTFFQIFGECFKIILFDSENENSVKCSSFIKKLVDLLKNYCIPIFRTYSCESEMLQEITMMAYCSCTCSQICNVATMRRHHKYVHNYGLIMSGKELFCIRCHCKYCYGCKNMLKMVELQAVNEMLEKFITRYLGKLGYMCVSVDYDLIFCISLSKI